MDHRIPLVLALMGFGTPALAADIDDIAPFAQAHVAQSLELGQQMKRASRGTSNGASKSHVTRASNGKGQSTTRMKANNGSRTVTASRGQSNQSTSRGAVSTDRTASRGRVTVSNDRGQSVTKSRGSTQGHVEVGGPRGGSLERERTTTRGQVTASNGNRTVVRTGASTGARTTVSSPRGHAAVAHRPAAVVHRPAAVAHRPVATRPGPRTVVTSGRPGPRPVVVHSAPARRTVVYRRVTPVHGVFVYGPGVGHHHNYANSGTQVKVQKAHLPTRAIDRSDSLAIGVKAGSLVSSDAFTGSTYGDLGLGVFGRYRPAESVGLQLDVAHHAGRSAFDLNYSERSQTQVAGSVELFAFPWTRVSPYAIGGVTWNARSLEEQFATGSATTVVETTDALWGLHGGLGVELAMGDRFALDLEGKYIGWIDRLPEDPAGALQANAALVYHF